MRGFSRRLIVEHDQLGYPAAPVRPRVDAAAGLDGSDVEEPIEAPGEAGVAVAEHQHTTPPRQACVHRGELNLVGVPE